MFKWTKCQKESMRIFTKWYKKLDKQVLEISGYAGTGKTSMLSELIRKIGLDIDEEVLAIAFTGRAASNLAAKGIPAKSIHSSLMNTVLIPKLDMNGNAIYKNGRPLTTLSFRKKEYLPKSIKLIIIEEGSFINSEFGLMAESFGLPIFVVGDNSQLPPIFGKSYYLNNPDYTMDEITRQAKNSGIIELATRIRLGKEIPNKKYMFKNDVFFLPKNEISDTILLNTDIILCGKNKTRNYFNKRIRNDILDIRSKLPVKGDKLICRQNYWNRSLGDISLTNGTLGIVKHSVNMGDIDIKNKTVKINFQPEYSDYDYYENINLDIPYFNEDCGTDKNNKYTFGMKFELGYSVTTHLAQGSEFDNVLYFDELMGGDKDFQRRLRYTATTRARGILVYAF